MFALRVIGLLSFYDESAPWLAGAVASLAGVCDHLIAVDGAYALYPQGKAHSGSEQGETIRETCRSLSMGCTLYEPQTVWGGNEVEKRSTMFALGETVAEPNTDWYFVIDADEVVTSWGAGRFKERLAECEHDVAEVTFWNRRIPHPREVDENRKWVAPYDQIELNRVRILFRAIPGLRVVDRHYHYRLPDGRYLWGDANQEPCADFSDVRLEHRTEYRDPMRRKTAQDYYTRRATLGIEP